MLSISCIAALSTILFSLIIPTSAAGYAPTVASCPATLPTIRPGSSTSPQESAYISKRQVPASQAFQKWLKAISSEFDVPTSPVIGLVTSGGGYRSMLSGAGVVQALDARDSKTPISGLYQALTYHTGLSGGSWLLSALAGNDNPTISSLIQRYWNPLLPDNPLVPDFDSAKWLEIAFQVAEDILTKYAVYDKNKELTGLDPTLTDPWGRFLSWALLPNSLSGVPGQSLNFSSVTNFASFKNFAIPYPIITALGVDTYDNQTMPGTTGTQYEFTPHEFGSWDTGISAFAPTQYLGTLFSSGTPRNIKSCVTAADNLGHILGTSSSLFNAIITFNLCPPGTDELVCKIFKELQTLLGEAGGSSLYANYQNPFLAYKNSPLVNKNPLLNLVDGGESNQNNPIWPLIQPARKIDVIIVNDNSADTGGMFKGGYPNGSQIYNTYLRARSVSPALTKMPVIPSSVRSALPTIFGCDEPNAATIVYLPNNNFTYNSGVSTVKFDFLQSEIQGIVGNGNAVANAGGEKDWPLCLACAVTGKSGGKRPAGCAGCREKYCYLGPKV
ncbi:acyl transferase/acyl hydrolase/lysophospholipase [Dendryphion nanum]|uniref:Lysophospholipase n=1 Tax=Dendryphion nanum TaxID=256645 RepID=A0A9P9DIV0_9PLEO|nr:acyl transferase/acyl hydrolase/lysophospholipase [Dendryphion nanum]